MKLAPIILFVYDRFEHTKLTIEALQKNKLSSESDLYIFSDGPKSKNALDKVNKVRNFIGTVKEFQKITVIESETNLGLANSIKNGITQILEKNNRVIVLEDDIVTSEYFLEYMNNALEQYENDERVMEISGYNYPITKNGLKETYFVRMAACWGWATWSRAWSKYTEDIEEIENTIVSEEREIFKVAKRYHYWDQLIANKKGTLKTWFIYWYASIFMYDGLVLYPRNSLVQNIGLDGSGNNSGKNNKYHNSSLSNRITYFEEKIEFNKDGHKAYQDYFKKVSTGIWRKFYRNIKRVIKEILQ